MTQSAHEARKKRMQENWKAACERQRAACGDPTPWELRSTGLRIPGPPKTNPRGEWAYKPRKDVS